MATNAISIHSAPIKEESAMSSRLVFALLIASMGIVMVWAFRPAPTIFTGYETPPSATKSDRIDSVPR